MVSAARLVSRGGQTMMVRLAACMRAMVRAVRVFPTPGSSNRQVRPRKPATAPAHWYGKGVNVAFVGGAGRRRCG